MTDRFLPPDVLPALQTAPDPRRHLPADPARRHACRALAALAGTALALPAPAARATGDALLMPIEGEPPAPPFTLRTLDGSTVSLDTLRGRLAIVNFWATWCAPCVEELPSLEALQQALGERATVLLVNLQEGEPRIRQFLAKSPVRLPIARDTDGAVTRAWDAMFLPTTVVVDAAGRRRLGARGALDWTRPVLLKRLDLLARS